MKTMKAYIKWRVSKELVYYDDENSVIIKMEMGFIDTQKRSKQVNRYSSILASGMVL